MSWRRGLGLFLPHRAPCFVDFVRSNQNPRRVPQVFSRFSASALGEIVVPRPAFRVVLKSVSPCNRNGSIASWGYLLYVISPSGFDPVGVGPG